MLSKIVKFELNYRFKKPMTYIFMAIMVFQSIWYIQGTYQYYVNDAMLYNSAGMVYQAMAGGGMLMIIVISIITGTALFKDIEFKTAETLYSYPIQDKTWILGKFISAYSVNLIIVMVYALGFTIIQYTGIAASDHFGPVPWGHIAYGFVLFSIPNMFIITMISLSMIVFFRNMVSSYIGVFIIMIFFIMAEGSRENAQHIVINYLLDPFAYCLTKDAIDLLPVAMKNSAYFSISGIYLANRALWIGITLLVTFFAFRKFNFQYFITKPSQKRESIAEDEQISYHGKLKQNITKIFGVSENFKKLFRLSKLEFLNTVRTVGFKIVAGLLAMMFFGYNYLWHAKYYIHTDTLPITSMMTSTRLPNGVFILILLAIFAGELLFKERSSDVWQITDTLPVPTWVTYFSKYIAMLGVSFIMASLLFVSGVFAQISQGYRDIEWLVYFNDLYSYHFGFINYLFAVTLAFFLGSVTGNRFAGHILSVAILFFIIVFADMGVIEQIRFMFPFTPGIDDYSEISGYGIYGTAALWYAILWGFLSIAFLLFGLWFWNRGSYHSLRKRFSFTKPQLGYGGKIAAFIFLGLFFYMEHFVAAYDHNLKNFKTNAQKEAENADYEKRYKYIEKVPQPKISGLDVTVSIDPNIRKADYSFIMRLTNNSSTAIDTLYLNLKDFVTLHSLKTDDKALSPAWRGKFGQLAYILPKPISPGETITIHGECTLQYIGFASTDSQRALVYNGSFLEEDIIPHIGYNTDRELDENRKRSLHNLEKIASRMSPLSDSSALQHDALSSQALRHITTLRVRTSNGQKVYASGKYIKDDNINGLTYAVYRTEQPFSMKWNIGSADYKTYRALLKNNTELEIYYDHRHAYNLKHMKIAADDAIEFLGKHLGKYPYSQLRITEIPFYNDDNFYAYPNLIAISEKHCWTADGKREKDLTYIYYTICREIATQWIKQSIEAADVQGAEMFYTALSEAYGLFYVKEKFGNEVLQEYLKKKNERYRKNRANEPNIEHPLIYADGADYLEANKGALALLWVMNNIGISKTTDLLLLYNNKKQGKLVFKDFYGMLKELYPDNQKEELHHIFEEVTEQ